MEQSLCSGCLSPRWNGAGPQGAPRIPPAPVWDLWGDTGALHQTDKKGSVSIRGKLGRSKATGEGAPGGVSICSQLTGGLPSQLPARSCDKTCSVLHPDLLPSHNAHLGASPCRSSSSLGTLCLHHHCPPSFTSPTKAADTPTLQHHHKPLVKGEKGASLLPVEVRASFSI